MNVKKSLFFITKTGILVALLLVLQWSVGLLSGNQQMVVGPVVNLILILSTLAAGLYSGMLVALLSPLFAFWLGIAAANTYFLPFIALGNIVLVLVWHFVAAKTLRERKSLPLQYVVSVVAAVAGALLKNLVLYVGIVKFAAPVLVKAPEAQITKFAISFGLTQTYTALIGGAVAVIVAPALLKALKSASKQ